MCQLDKTIELYAKLIIAFISFITPVVGYLASIYKHGAEKLKVHLKDKLGDYRSQKYKIIQNIQNEKKDQINSEFLDKKSKEIKKLDRESKMQISKMENKIKKLENFERCVGVLLIGFLAAFILVCMYFVWQNNYFKIGVFLLSVCIFIICLVELWEVFKLITEVKRLEDLKKKSEYDEVLSKIDRLIEVSEDGFDSQHIPKSKVKLALNNVESEEGILEINLDPCLLNVEQNIKINISNESKTELKDINIRIEIPKEFKYSFDSKLDKTSVDEKNNILFFKYGKLNSGFVTNDRKLLVSSGIKGEYQIRIYLFAENMKEFICGFIKIVLLETNDELLKAMIEKQQMSTDAPF